MRRPATGKIKIAYVIGTLDHGGAEHQLVALAKGLDQSKFLPVVFCLMATGPLLSALTRAGIQVRCFGLRGLTVRRNPILVAKHLAEFVRCLKKEGPDIVHAFLFHAYTLGSFAARMARIPVVLSSRRSLGHFKAGKPHYLALERIANRLTDLVIANSEAVRQDAIRAERLPAERVVVIHNGIDLDRFGSPPDEGLRRSLGLEGWGPVIGVVANFIHYKGHRFFLQACQEIKRKHSEVKFLLIGDGPLRGELEDLAEEIGLEKNVLFLGSRQDVPQLLGLVDVAVLPSLEEGFSNAVLEAMAAGKPIVATNVGGVPEAVVHGETGLLVPPRDSQALAEALLWFLKHPTEAARFGEAGRRRVAGRFELSAMVRQYEAVYERLMEEKNLSRAFNVRDRWSG